jgi:NAD(P)-dependent dehydrogenase (short-subunit alcohol dehydrogenase family)
VLLVTGASSGIGRATALRAAARGDHVALLSRDEGTLKEAAEECEAAGAASTLVLPCDVRDDAAVADGVEAVVARHGRLDAVAHCAGVVAYGRAEEVPPEVFDDVLSTNVSGSMNVARHALRTMRRQRQGTLVLVGSVIGHIAAPTMTPYAVSKWAVRALARQLQIENRDLPGVRVGYVAPGGVLTPIYEQAANYAGWAGRPPPPVDSPEKVARVVLEQVDHPAKRRQVGLGNGVVRFGFSALPGVYDAIVAPLFTLAATDRTRPVPPTTGNVRDATPERNRVHGHQPGVVLALGRNAVALLRPRRTAEDPR